MKQIIVFVFIMLLASSVSASELSETFSEKYSSLTPKPNSSVQSDYLFEQIALGSEYTIKMLDMINSQGEETNTKFDVMIEKLDILIDQNNRLIKLLENNRKLNGSD